MYIFVITNHVSSLGLIVWIFPFSNVNHHWGHCFLNADLHHLQPCSPEHWWLNSNYYLQLGKKTYKCLWRQKILHDHHHIPNKERIEGENQKKLILPKMMYSHVKVVSDIQLFTRSTTKLVMFTQVLLVVTKCLKMHPKGHQFHGPSSKLGVWALAINVGSRALE